MVVNFIVALFAMTFAATMGYWAQDRNPPVEFRHVAAATPIVAPGGTLKVRYHIERRRQCHVIVEQVIYDSQNVRFQTPDEDFTTAPGDTGPDIFSLAMQVPYTASEGRARHRSVRSYYCNPIHYWFSWPIVVTTPDVMFDVVDPRFQPGADPR